jgi:hypothetical protein
MLTLGVNLLEILLYANIDLFIDIFKLDICLLELCWPTDLIGQCWGNVDLCSGSTEHVHKINDTRKLCCDLAREQWCFIKYIIKTNAHMNWVQFEEIKTKALWLKTLLLSKFVVSLVASWHVCVVHATWKSLVCRLKSPNATSLTPVGLSIIHFFFTTSGISLCE